MQKYIITSEAFKGYILLTYKDYYLVAMEIQADMTKEHLDWFFTNLQLHSKFVKVFMDKINQSGIWKMSKYKEEITFENFWEQYNYKVGNKKRAHIYWNKMNDSERLKALYHIKRYDRALKLTPHVQKLYPDSYLSQARWNN